MPSGVYLRAEEAKRNMSLAHKGQVPWNKDKTGLQIPWNKGLIGVQVCSEETRRKQSEAHRVENLSEETRRKLSEANKNNTAFLGKRHSKETRNKISEALIGLFLGDKCSQWKGGITPLNEKVRGSSIYKKWHTLVFERDNYTCQMCGEKGGRLNAHHIKSFSQYPELRFDIDNGITYCKPCHFNSGLHNKALVA